MNTRGLTIHRNLFYFQIMDICSDFTPLCPCCRCSNQTAAWQLLIPQPEELSIQTNVTYSESRKTSQVRSQVTFHKPQQVTVRCETSNQAGLVDRRDVKLVSSSRCQLDLAVYIPLRTCTHACWNYGTLYHVVLYCIVCFEYKEYERIKSCHICVKLNKHMVVGHKTTVKNLKSLYVKDTVQGFHQTVCLCVWSPNMCSCT